MLPKGRSKGVGDGNREALYFPGLLKGPVRVARASNKGGNLADRKGKDVNKQVQVRSENTPGVSKKGDGSENRTVMTRKDYCLLTRPREIITDQKVEPWTRKKNDRKSSKPEIIPEGGQTCNKDT